MSCFGPRGEVMRASKFCIIGCSLGVALAASAQDRKPGVYEVTMTTTTAAPSVATYPPRTIQVCLTQAMIDKYGAIVPDNVANICQLTNVVKKAGGMSADLVCSSGMTGSGTIEVNWTDSEHTKGKIHFSGSIHPQQNEIKIEWDTVTASAYKGPDCSVLTRPAAPQANPPKTAPPPPPPPQN